MDAIGTNFDVSSNSFCFNPRARDGRDVLTCLGGFMLVVSIHAPVMDAIVKRFKAKEAGRFNPRARDGRDVKRLQGFICYRVSIHAPVMDAIC